MVIETQDEKVPNSQDSPCPLTNRELEVLQLAGTMVTDGFVGHFMEDREIADKLYTSVSTVKKHLANIFEKLNVHGRHEAVKFAQDKGWIKCKS
jgi:DNA-binding NarL/FixJ family response regulator